MKNYVKTRTYIDAVNIENQKDLDLFKKKLQYSMPLTPLKDVPKDDPDPDERNRHFPPLFNRLNRYRDYNRRRRRRKLREEVQLPEIGEVRLVEIVEQETVL